MLLECETAGFFNVLKPGLFVPVEQFVINMINRINIFNNSNIIPNTL